MTMFTNKHVALLYVSRQHFIHMDLHVSSDHFINAGAFIWTGALSALTGCEDYTSPVLLPGLCWTGSSDAPF